MVMLQTVIRPSMERPLMAGPEYSITWPTPPSTPIRPIVARIRSLAVTPGGSSPEYEIRMERGLRCWSVWVASTCSTSLVPIPNASAPNAPCVEVCESPQTIVIPGWVTPSSGPITCTIPWLSDPIECTGMPNSLAVLLERADLRARERVAHHRERGGAVGGHVVVGGGERAVGAADLAARQAQGLERLRARDLVHQVEVDVEEPVVRPRGAPRSCRASSCAIRTS